MESLKIKSRCHQSLCAVRRNQIVLADGPLVEAIVLKYVGRGLQVRELARKGRIGLRRAAESFDPDQGARFSTWASWWTKQAMKVALARASRANPRNDLDAAAMKEVSEVSHGHILSSHDPLTADRVLVAITPKRSQAR